jgi:hypothetical protein
VTGPKPATRRRNVRVLTGFLLSHDGVQSRRPT